MYTSGKSFTAEDVLASLGFADPMAAARQQARMILLGRRARYEAEINRFEGKWKTTLAELSEQYEAIGTENAAADDDYLHWRWFADAIETVNAQLGAVSAA